MRAGSGFNHAWLEGGDEEGGGRRLKRGSKDISGWGPGSLLHCYVTQRSGLQQPDNPKASEPIHARHSIRLVPSTQPLRSSPLFKPEPFFPERQDNGAVVRRGRSYVDEDEYEFDV